MHRERLSRLITVLAQVPPEKLDMSIFGHSFGHGTSCSTTACAVGWACHDAGFNAEGLHGIWDHTRLSPRFETEKNWCAVERFFGLTSDQAEELFQAYMYDPDPTPQHVIARIKELLDNGQ